MKNSKNIYLVLIIFLVAIAQSGLALYLPSLPAIQHYFNISASFAQLTVFFYVGGVSISQLIYGPLSDAYGRKSSALWGLAFFIIGCFIAIFAININFLFVGRGIQGVGMGAVMTISRAILRDVYKGTDYVKNASRLASVFAISPVIFPVIGGYIQFFLGWRAIFCSMLLLSLIAFFIWFYLFNETQSHRRTFSFKDYSAIAKSTIFWKNAICGGLIYSGEVIFLTMAPFLIQENFHLSASCYGWLILVGILGFIVGSQCSSYLSEKLKHFWLIVIGLGICFIAVIIMILENLVAPITIASILFSVSIFMLGAGFVYPNTSIGAVGHFSEKAGTASALLSSTQGVISTMGIVLVSTLKQNTFVVMTIIFTIIILLALLLGISIFYEERNHVLE